ncbi:hypothetical protein BY996DRAFT_6428063 [Phakopsora pachyrhizi]|nr:hypothetical protein BY996DRAFT_6428063 [Phakopsora pachyrhizi]
MCCFYSAARTVQRPCAPGKGPSEGPALDLITANPVTCEADLSTNAVDKILATQIVPSTSSKTPASNTFRNLSDGCCQLQPSLTAPSARYPNLLKVIGNYTLGKVIGQAFFGPKVIPGAFMFMCSD